MLVNISNHIADFDEAARKETYTELKDLFNLQEQMDDSLTENINQPAS